MPDLGALLVQADARHLPLRDESVQCVVTSPPYWGLRDYGTLGQLGLEPTPEEYVANMVEVFREVRRVLRPGGTLWLNLGDSYAASRSGPIGASTLMGDKHHAQHESRKAKEAAGRPNSRWRFDPWGLKPKDLVGIPWRVAFALQMDGWYLRSDIIWHKPNPMPESVGDRPTKAHEYLFLLTKSERYFYDADAIKEPVSGTAHARGSGVHPKSAPAGSGVRANESFSAAVRELVDERNKRDVWTVASRPYSGAHFATFPEALVEPCIKAGSRPGDVVLDPFNGSGTTGRVALRLGRSYVGTDISREYLAEQAVRRLDGVQMEAVL